MKIGKYTLRKPWVTWVEIDLGAEIYAAVRKSIGEDIAQEIEAIPIEISTTNALGMQIMAAAIARGQK